MWLISHLNKWLKDNQHLARWALVALALIPVGSTVFGWISGLVEFPKIPVSYYNIPESYVMCTLNEKNETAFEEFVDGWCETLVTWDSVILSYEHVEEYLEIMSEGVSDIEVEITKTNHDCSVMVTCLP